MEQSKTCQMKTDLFDRHCALGAKMVEFGGWLMPVYYQGIIQEHISVRQRVGLFDVSHMGRIRVFGPEAEPFLDYLSTNSLLGKSNFSATYTVLPMANGGCVDDVIVYKQSQDQFFVIVNAGNRVKDLAHFQKESQAFKVTVEDCYADEGIIAIQGPRALDVVSETFSIAKSLRNMHFCEIPYKGVKGYLSATGYTGAGGYEVYAPKEMIAALWDLWLDSGRKHGIVPIGLGARDTLRLEKGYALYGHEISETIFPNESVSAWTVKWDKPDFLGKKAMEELEKKPNKRNEYGVILIEPGIARADYEVFVNGNKIGIVTSGTQSPSLNQAIAIVLVEYSLKVDDVIEIQIRKNRVKAKVVKLPFL